MQTELLSIKEAAAVLNCGVTSFYKMLNNGQLKGVRLNGKTLIPRTELDEFIASLETYKPQKLRGV